MQYRVHLFSLESVRERIPQDRWQNQNNLVILCLETGHFEFYG